MTGAPVATSQRTIVTGASGGIGAAIAARASARGPVVTIQRSPGPAGTTHVAADLSDGDRAVAAVDTALGLVDAAAGGSPGGRVVLVHAAATIQPIGFAGEVDTSAVVAAMQLNVVAAIAVGQAFLSAVRGRPGRRQLCQLTSGAAGSVYAGWSTYGPSKAAVDHWVATVAVEQAERGGVEVVGVSPGLVATGMQELIRDTDARDFPRVDKFREAHEAGELRDTDAVAAQTWALLDGDVPTGEAVDLRTWSG